jgi:concanavalin A-like lectin/glucanase superfamily protein
LRKIQIFLLALFFFVFPLINVHAQFEDEYTKLLIHSDTTDGSTTFVDVAAHHPITPLNASHSTSYQKFGASSIYLPSAQLTVSDSEDLEFGDGDFTIDFWLYPTSATITGSRKVMGTFHSGPQGWVIFVDNGDLYLKVAINNSWQVDLRDPQQLIANTWYHCAVVRNGDTWSIYKNGNRVASTTATGSVTPGEIPLTIGDGGLYWFTGYLDEIRVSKGIARWTADSFPVPTAPYEMASPLGGNNFSADSSCVALWRLEPNELTLDSNGSNTLSDNNTVESLTNTHREGFGCADFEKDNVEYLTINDSRRCPHLIDSNLIGQKLFY